MKKITDYAELVKAKHALNKTIAPVEDGASMAGSYTSGKQFIRDSVLYSALTSIAAGTAWSSLTLDTDYEVADDVSTQIAAVNQTLTNEVSDISDEIADMNNVLGAKNIFLNGAVSKTENGITFTVNSDGTVSVSGTATSNTYFIFPIISLKKGTYIISGCPDINQSETKAFLYIASLSVFDYGNGKDFTLSSDNDNINVAIRVNEGASFSSVVTFKPMLRLASIQDDTYVPYSMTNREMTPYVQAISNPNLLDNPWFTVNQRGQNSYSGNVYGYDRWIGAANSSVESDTNGVKIINTLWQRFESDFITKISGKSVTLSVLLGDGTIYSASGIASSANGTFITIDNDVLDARFIKDNYFTFVHIHPKDSSGLVIRAVKLELGSVSTLAHDTAPNYQQELAKCQRYFYRHKGAYEYVGYFNTATNFRANLALPVPMRAIPSMTLETPTDYAQCAIYDAQGSLVQPSAIAVDTVNSIVGQPEILLNSTVATHTQNICGVQRFNLQMDLSADL